MRFRSGIGIGAAFVGFGAIGIALSMAAFWRADNWPMVGLGAGLICLVAWLVLGTRYTVAHGELVARVGPMRRRIRLAEITAIHRRAVEKGAMFGVGSDFVGIEYGAKALNVSPRDADGFVEAVRAGMEAPAADR